MKLIVGLGNPGKPYENTRHNIGFQLLNQRVSRNHLENRKLDNKYKAEIIKTNFNTTQLLLCKPQTYMNLSGQAVAPLAKFYQISPHKILVIHDEIDFATGRIALKLGGSPAGHNGLKNIIEKIGSREFWRLRIGVDRPIQNMQVADWVLGKFKREEYEQIAQKEQEIFTLIENFLAQEEN